VTSRRRDMIGINEGFSGGKCCEPLDLRDLTVEIDSTVRIPRPMGPINRGLHSVVTLCFHL